MDELVNSTSPDDGEVNLLDYLIFLAKHSRVIIFTSAAVTILTYFYYFCSVNIYKATARLLPPQQNLTLSAHLLESLGSRVSPGTRGYGLSAGDVASNLLSLKSSGYLYISMLTSNTVLDRIITRFHLMEFYKTKYLDDARKELTKNAKLSLGKKDGIIVIEVTCTSLKLAPELANAFIEELDRLLQGLAVQEARGRLTFLEKERLQASQNLTKAEEAVRLFSEQNSVVQMDTQTRGALEYIARLRAEIDAKEVSIEVLGQQATPFNYDVVRLETEVKGLKEKLRAAEIQKDNCVNDVCVPTNKAPSLGLEYLRLFREAKFQEGLYQLFTRLVEIARLDIVRDVSVVQVLDSAKPPERKSNKRLFPALAGGMIFFFLMVMVILAQELLKKRNMKQNEDFVRRLMVLKDYLTPWTDIIIKMNNITKFKNKLRQD
jgi:tyrosine-protein kinase Etk/Wzc